MQKLIERIELFLEGADRLDEEGKKHSPFKRKQKLGPGPRGGTNTKTGEWDCNCNGYQCQCTHDDGSKKTIKIKRGYKQKYNKQYKKWKSKNK